MRLPRCRAYFLEYLDKDHYLGLEGEQQLVDLATVHEIRKDIYDAKTPEFVFSYAFEFDRFSRSPDFALAVSVFTHLTEDDIRLCLRNLAKRVTTSCQLFASFFETQRPCPTSSIHIRTWASTIHASNSTFLDETLDGAHVT